MAWSCASVLALAQTPRLEHGTAWLGGQLELQFSGLAPGAAFDLWFSREAGTWQLPYGVLELRRDRARRVATGSADASGHASVVLALTSDPASAEIPLRFQAVVAAPGTPAGKTLTNAIALRLTGPRVYAGFHSATSAGLYVLDPLHDGVVATVDYGFATEADESHDEGQPVFDRALTTGAACAGRRHVVFFDPHFGLLRDVRAFSTDVSRTLHRDAAGERVFVLETGDTVQPATLRTFDLRSRAEIATLTLPNAVSELWSVNRDASLAAIAEFDASGHPRVRFVDLVNSTDLGVRPAGSRANTHFDALVWGWGEVWTSTRNALGVGALDGTLSRLPPPGSPEPPLIGAGGGVPLIQDLVVVPTLGRVLLPHFFYSVPATQLFELPLRGDAPATAVPGPGPYLHVDETAVDGAQVWFLDRAGNEPPGGSEPGRVFGLELSTHTWTQLPRTWPFAGPADVAVLHDRFVEYVVVANVALPPPIAIPPEVTFHSPVDGSELNFVLPEPVSFVASAPVPPR
jgi:hypothetical protein